MANIKNKILQECINQVQKSVDLAQAEMQEHQKMANDYGQPRDRYDAFRNQMIRKRDQFAKQYQRGLDDLAILDKIDNLQSSTKAEFGAVVVTNMNKLFISISLGKLVIEGEEYFAISTKVPIFNAIEGLEKGSTFSFNGRQFQILDVF